MESIDISLIVAITVGLVYPGYALISGRSTYRYLSDHPDKKVKVLLTTGMLLLIMMSFTLLPFLFGKTEVDLIGLDFVFNPFWTLCLLAASLLSWWIFNRMKISIGSAQDLMKAYSRVDFVLPRNEKEYQSAILVSFIAGFCEEVIYRGFLLWYLAGLMPLWLALIFANLPFALAHLGSTGIKNALQTLILAAVFTGAFLLTGSLWLAILLHIMVDLYAVTTYYRSQKLLQLSD